MAVKLVHSWLSKERVKKQSKNLFYLGHKFLKFILNITFRIIIFKEKSTALTTISILQHSQYQYLE